MWRGSWRVALESTAVRPGLEGSIQLKSKIVSHPYDYHSTPYSAEQGNAVERSSAVSVWRIISSSSAAPPYYRLVISRGVWRVSQSVAIFLTTFWGCGVKLLRFLLFYGAKRSPPTTFLARRAYSWGTPVCSRWTRWRVLFHPTPLFHNYQKIVIGCPVKSFAFVLLFQWGRRLRNGEGECAESLNFSSPSTSILIFFQQSPKSFYPTDTSGVMLLVGRSDAASSWLGNPKSSWFSGAYKDFRHFVQKNKIKEVTHSFDWSQISGV